MQSPGGSRKLQATADPALVKAQTVAEAVRQMQNVGVSSAATTVPWTGVTGTPTTLAGYGITNAAIGVGGVAVNATTAVTAGTVTTAAQPAITSVGTLTGLTVKGTVAIAGASSGAVSFVAQSAAGSTTYVLPNADGINNDVLTTDGSGNLTWSVKAGGGGGTISTINGDGSAAQTIAAGAGLTIGNAGAVHTLALDLNYAPTYTTTVTAAGFVGSLTGNATTATTASAVPWSGVTSTPTTLAGYGITDAYTKTATDSAILADLAAFTGSSNIVTVGTLSGGAVPASLVTAGTFGAGSYVIAVGSLGLAGNFGTPSTTGNGQLFIGTQTTLGFVLTGQGSVSDARFFNKSGAAWLDLPTGTINPTFAGNVAIGGTLNVVSDFSVATSKFTVDHATGNTVAAGTIGASNFSGSSSGTNTGDQTSFAWSAVTGTPTTLSGYGITDAYTKTAADARYAPIAGPFPWSDVSSTPTSLGGYGITDAYTKSASDARFAAISGPFPWSDVSGTPTTLAGYGITDAYTKTASDARYSPIAGSSSIVTVGTLGSLAIGTQFSFNGSSGAFAMQLISFNPAGTNIVTLAGIGLRITAPLGSATRFDADQNTGAITTASSITTGTPSGGTAAPWKMGSLITTLFSGALIPTQYVELDVSGTLCKLALIT